VTLSDEDLKLFEGRGSHGHHRVQAEAERARLRQLHLDHTVTGYTGDDDVAADRARAQAIGADIVGSTPLSTWARYDNRNRQALAVRPDCDADVEDYEQVDDTTEEEARRWGPAQTVAKYDRQLGVGDSMIAFPRQRFA
jgi:hypothetical protein